MATTKTRRDLVLRTLDVLGVSAVGQSPAAEDYATVDAQVDPVLGTLAGLEVVYVADPDEILAEFLNPIADVLAYAVSTDFGIGDQERSGMQVKDAQAKADLKFMNRGRPTGQRMTAEYF